MCLNAKQLKLFQQLFTCRTLIEAAAKNDLQLLERALNHEFGVFPEEDVNNALLRAATTGNSDCVTLLLSRGADPDARDIDGDTPLMQAAANNHMRKSSDME